MPQPPSAAVFFTLVGPVLDYFEFFFISPAQHQIHHSTKLEHHNCNFGTILAIWDLIGQTLLRSKGQENLEFGSSNLKGQDHSLETLYLSPFVDVAKIIKHTYLKEIVDQLRQELAKDSLNISTNVLITCEKYKNKSPGS